MERSWYSPTARATVPSPVPRLVRKDLLAARLHRRWTPRGTAASDSSALSLAGRRDRCDGSQGSQGPRSCSDGGWRRSTAQAREQERKVLEADYYTARYLRRPLRWRPSGAGFIDDVHRPASDQAGPGRGPSATLDCQARRACPPAGTRTRLLSRSVGRGTTHSPCCLPTRRSVCHRGSQRGGSIASTSVARLGPGTGGGRSCSRRSGRALSLNRRRSPALPATQPTLSSSTSPHTDHLTQLTGELERRWGRVDAVAARHRLLRHPCA